MLLRKCFFYLFLIGCTSLFAMDKEFNREVFLCASDTPTEVLGIILDNCNKLKRYKLCMTDPKHFYNERYGCFTPYDDISTVEADFENHAIASKNVSTFNFHAYVLSDGSIISLDGKEIGKTSPSKLSYLRWQEEEKLKAKKCLETWQEEEKLKKKRLEEQHEKEILDLIKKIKEIKPGITEDQLLQYFRSTNNQQ